MRKVLVIFLVGLFFTSALLIPAGVTSDSTSWQETGESELVTRLNVAPALPSELVPNIRVAIYDEPNTTAPDYATDSGAIHNNATGLRDILMAAGYEVTLLDVHEIYNDALTVLDFDVVVLNDNFPRENITTKIKDFWMSGGGILSVDGASGYLCYFGILPSEAMDTSGEGDYWSYLADDVNITTMHPISQDFTLGQVIPTAYGPLRWNWTALQETSIADDLIRISRSNNDPDSASILAYDPSGIEGRIVTIPHDFVFEYLRLIDNMVPDAVSWLAGSSEPQIYDEHTIRIAVYDQPNTTLPDYGTGVPAGVVQSNAPAVADVLTSFGYQVTLLDTSDIENFQLKTADFDVLVLADSLPHNNITTMILDFWLGGGAIFAMDSSIDFLCYFGILPQESDGSFGNETYFTYTGTDINITTRHPVTKSYYPGDQLDLIATDYAAWNWTTLQATSIAADLAPLAHSIGDENAITVLALDPSDRGGKIVTLSSTFSPAAGAIHQLMADAMDWLCTRPKARILFDLSHQSYYPVDNWDDAELTGTRYAPWRNYMVSSHYTFDKYYAGNFTAENLAPYDMLIINAPGLNFTATEVAVVTDWVADGGGLYILSDWTTFFDDYNLNVNYLLSNFSIYMNLAEDYVASTTSDITLHPIKEGISELYFQGGNWVNYTSPAYPLVMDGPNTLVAAQEFGHGRIMLSGDINQLANQIDISDNHQFGINAANWLTSGNAQVLVYADTASHDPNNNVYRGPVAQALNDLGISFQLTFSVAYFELSFYEKEWDLVVFDNINYPSTSVFDELLGYLENGGQLIINTWLYSSSLGTALWDYIGFEYEGPNFSPPPDIYIWESDSLLLDSYSGDSIITDTDFIFGTEAANLTIHDNATALAGLSPSPSTTNVSIILGADGNAIANGMLISLYANDTDDSTYTDSFEIWRDEIAFLMFDPELSINTPADVPYEAGTTGHEIVWNPTSNDPGHFAVFQNGILVDSGSWDGSSIVIDVDDHDLGEYTYEVIVSHILGYTVTDVVEVIIVDTTAPSFVDGPDNLQYEVGTMEHLLIWSFSDFLPESYVFYINGTEDDSGAWDGSELSVDVGGLSEGVYNVTIAVDDTSGNLATSTVYLTVIEAITTTDTLIIIIIAIGGVVLIITIIIMKRRGS